MTFTPVQGGHALARVGNGRKLHALDANGRVRCENHMSAGGAITGPYLRQDGNGQYQDVMRVSEVHPAGERGTPTCHWCAIWLDE